MKKYLVFVVAFILVFLFFSYNLYSDINTLKNIKVEISDVSIVKILPNMVLNISVEFINEGGRGVEGLEGRMDIYILDEIVGNISFCDINVAKHSSKRMDIPLTLYYDEIAKGILKAIEKMDFNLTIRGVVKAKIFFGLLSYETPVMARWE